jgi:hypothetical protein
MGPPHDLLIEHGKRSVLAVYIVGYSHSSEEAGRRVLTEALLEAYLAAVGSQAAPCP